MQNSSCSSQSNVTITSPATALWLALMILYPRFFLLRPAFDRDRPEHTCVVDTPPVDLIKGQYMTLRGTATDRVANEISIFTHNMTVCAARLVARNLRRQIAVGEGCVLACPLTSRCPHTSPRCVQVWTPGCLFVQTAVMRRNIRGDHFH